MQITVYYEDTDTGGVVYHSNYLNFCERARSEAFFKKGMTPVLSTGHFVARRVEADYFLPSRLGDALHVETSLLEMKAASFKLQQVIYKEDKKIFSLIITLAYINFDGRPQKLDKDTKDLLLSLFE